MQSVVTQTMTKPKMPLFEFIALMALLTSLVALAIDAMLPALSIIGQELGSTSSQQTYLVVTLFFSGMALGQIFFGPFCDARGRRLTILVGLIIFGLGTLVCYVAQDMYTLLAGRLVQAFGVSGPRIASMALIRDQYVGDAMARVMSFITVIFILVPMVAPLIGQAVIEFFHWRQIFTVFFIVAVISGLWFFIRHPETLPRDKRQRFKWSFFFSSCWWLIKHPVVLGYSLAMGFIFGAFLAYLSGSQTIFEDIYQMGDKFPILFAILAFSIGLASLFNGMLVMRFGMRALCGLALVMSIVFAVALTVLTIIYDGVPPLLVFMGTMFFGFFFIGSLFGNLNAMAMQPVGHIAGMGAAFIGCFTSLISVPIATFINQFLSDDLLPIALGFLCFNVLSFIVVKIAQAYSSEG